MHRIDLLLKSKEFNLFYNYDDDFDIHYTGLSSTTA